MKSFKAFLKEAPVGAQNNTPKPLATLARGSKVSTQSGNLSDPQGDVSTSYNIPKTGNSLMDRNVQKIGGGRIIGYSGLKLAD